MTAHELVAKVKNLPPISQAALRLVNLLDEPAVSNDDVVQVLKYDNVLTAKLLRACNSPYFGIEEPVSSVDQAVLIIGHEQILHIVLTLAFGGTMAVPLAGYAVEANELWRHSLTTAAAAEFIGSNVVEINIDPHVAFTIGLLHDIGKLVLNQVLTPEHQARIQAGVARGLSRSEAEREVLGADHAETGGALLQAWNLPEDIIEAVANHHHPIVEPQPKFSAIANIADSLAHRVGSAPGLESHVVCVDLRTAEAFNLTPERMETIVAEVRDSCDRVDQLMNMG
ncbi:MAG TPA: HDOD domain-containing protein [Verrucomicrobiae bacterium]|jgi:putative nucleotidyltransferase with HDIG domain|nr:HDOD domain-containing protein [Verrucomicrobiae bacterium]